MEQKTPSVAMGDRAIAEENWSAYENARDNGHSDWIPIAEKCNNFYMGGGAQWNPKDKQKLDEEGRPALESNMVLSTVNAVLGERINQDVELRFQPTVDGTTDLADEVLTPLARHIQEDNNYQSVEGEVFADGVIQDRGFFDIRMDFDKDARGEIRITSEDPVTVLPSPYAKDYDTRKWPELVTSRWMSLDEIEVEYGKEHRKKLELWGSSSADNLGRYAQDCVEWADSDHRFGDTSGTTYEDASERMEMRRLRIIERQHKKLGRVRMFVHNVTGDMNEIPDDMPEERAQELAQKYNMTVVTRVKQRIRWTVTCGPHVIWDKWSPYRWITKVGYFPYFRRGKPFGIVRNLLSPQEALNKSISQELHIVNTTANSGWAVEAGSLTNMTEQELEERGAETGLVLVYRAGANPPEKIKPNNVPTGIDRISQKAAASIQTISGIYDSMLGSQSSEVSGVALNTSLNRASVQLQVPFDHLNQTRQILAEMMYDLIRDFYSEERIYHIIDYKTPDQSTREVMLNKPQPDGSVLNDVTVGEYKVTVNIGPSRKNVQEVQFAEAIELRNAGVYIPDYVVVKNSHLRDRDELAETLRKLEGFAEPTEEEIEAARIQQQIDMELIMTELEMNKAKAMLLQAQAAQAMAKARELEGTEQVKYLEMQADIEKTLISVNARWNELQANLNNKLQLAGLHADNKDQLTRYQTSAKQSLEAFKERQNNLRTAATLANSQNSTNG